MCLRKIGLINGWLKNPTFIFCDDNKYLFQKGSVVTLLRMRFPRGIAVESQRVGTWSTWNKQTIPYLSITLTRMHIHKDVHTIRNGNFRYPLTRVVNKLIRERFKFFIT